MKRFRIPRKKKKKIKKVKDCSIGEFDNIMTLYELYSQYMNYINPKMKWLKVMRICITYPKYDLKSNEYEFDVKGVRMANREEMKKWYNDNYFGDREYISIIDNLMKYSYLR